MRLSVKNLGMIKDGELELNGITVIAGKNGVGKSTIGKILYCLCRTFYHSEDKVREELLSEIETILRWQSRYDGFNYRRILSSLQELAEFILSHYETTGKILLPEEILTKDEIGQLDVSKLQERLQNALSVEANDILQTIFYRCTLAEFGGQLNPINHPTRKMTARIEWDTGNQLVVSSIGKKKPILVSGRDAESDAVFIDDPYLIDAFASNIFISIPDTKFYHKNDLINRIQLSREQNSVVGNILGEKAWKELDTLLSGICDGTLTRDRKSGYGYVSSSFQQPVSLEALSTGTKSILLLKTLIENSNLTEDSLLIFDEPEVHLHPEWQFQLANILVLLPRILGAKVLISTHSSDFMSAIDYYSKKNDMQAYSKFYQIVREEDHSILEDVTGRVDQIYSELSRPFLQIADEL